MRSQVLHGDSRMILREYPDNFFDSCCTDAPYELGFMGKRWDSTGIAYDTELWEQVFRVLKPGAHLAAFGGTRTYHRMTCAIEDAGFEIRDSLHWIYGSGFPKSLDISKAIDKTTGAEREVIARPKTAVGVFAHSGKGVSQDIAKYADAYAITAPATQEAVRWDGWGTALKPSHEPIVLARKPFPGSVAPNVLSWGTGGININASRVAHLDGKNPSAARRAGKAPGREIGSWANDRRTPETFAAEHPGEDSGRWPPNILLTHSADCDDHACASGCPVLELNTQSEASRFFPCFKYQAKAASKERPCGEVVHSTVKPLELMRWLVRLITPLEGVVLDPFAGSGTTGEACVQEGMSYVLIEKEADYIQLIHDRLSQPSLFEEL